MTSVYHLDVDITVSGKYGIEMPVISEYDEDRICEMIDKLDLHNKIKKLVEDEIEKDEALIVLYNPSVEVTD